MDVFDPKSFAESILSVQPMPDDCFANLYKASKSETELKLEGFEPVSNLRVMYIRKAKESNVE